jgi:hypothetical protein
MRARHASRVVPVRSTSQVLGRIRVTGRPFRDVCDEALDVLQASNSPVRLFARANQIVSVEPTEEGRYAIVEVRDDKLRHYLARAADFFAISPAGSRREIPPPLDVVRNILARSPSDWGLPKLQGVIDSPTLRADGTILKQPGYDPSSGLFLDPPANLHRISIAEAPSPSDRRRSLGLIQDVLADFPFVDDRSHANAFAALLTATCRQAIPGATPLALIDATTPGTGKTLLAEVISLVATGRPADLFTAPRAPDEWRKQLTSLLRQGCAIVVIDNLATRLDSPELCKVLTAETHCDRLLGTSQIIALPVRCSWLATGNNLQLGGDMLRRCYWIRMDPQCSEPFRRGNFRHPNLKEYVLSRRPDLLSAVLTLGRAWFAAGKPRPRMPPLGSFEHWSTVIGGMLQFAGIEGFLENAQELCDQADTETGAWERFLGALNVVFGREPFTVAQLWQRLNGTSNSELYEAQATVDNSDRIRAALPNELTGSLEQEGLFRQRMGLAFRAIAGRRFGRTQVRVEKCAADAHNKVARWRVVLDA